MPTPIKQENPEQLTKWMRANEQIDIVSTASPTGREIIPYDEWCNKTVDQYNLGTNRKCYVRYKKCNKDDNRTKVSIWEQFEVDDGTIPARISKENSRSKTCMA